MVPWYSTSLVDRKNTVLHASTAMDDLQHRLSTMSVANDSDNAWLNATWADQKAKYDREDEEIAALKALRCARQHWLM